MPHHQAELAEADRRIAEADRNISQLGSLIPQLAMKGYATAEVAGQVEMMVQVLHNLQAQRQAIAVTLETGGMPSIAQPHRRATDLRTVSDADQSSWRTFYKRFTGA